jgi:hypothetical protein
MFIFKKKKPQKKFQWVRRGGINDLNQFTFDGEKIYELFEDYPHNLTEEERELFKEASPYWAKFFGQL